MSFGGLPDNRFDQVALLDVVKQVEKWVGKFRPDAIYTHHPGDLNIDHGITFRAVLTATRPGASAVAVPDVYAFEVPSSTEWAFQRIEPVFRPSVFVDIAAGLEKKDRRDAVLRERAARSPAPSLAGDAARRGRALGIGGRHGRGRAVRADSIVEAGVRIAFLIMRSPEYRVYAPVIEAALARGWEVECWHDYSQLQTGLKGYQFPSIDSVPGFRSGRPVVRSYQGRSGAWDVAGRDAGRRR